MIKIVIGKPGTGKTYHTVRYLVKYLEIQAKKEGAPRRVFTNISLNYEELQKYFDSKGLIINVSEVIVRLTEEDLRFSRKYLDSKDVKHETRGYKKYEVINPKSKAFFWNRIEDRALIIIDEIQKYIGSVKEYGESEHQSLIEYFSLHRHKKHDWVFLTQSLMSLSVDVRRVSEQVDELFNIKTMTLPFPLSIPVQDVFILLRAFGVVSQVYRVRSGYLENSYRVVYEGPLEVVKMSPDIFKLYQTHTLIKEDSALDSGGEQDLPFDLGKGAAWRAIKWFAKKHYFHLSLKIGVVVFVLVLARGFLWGWRQSVVNANQKLLDQQAANVEKPNQDLVVSDPVLTEVLPEDNSESDSESLELERGENLNIPIKPSIVITDSSYTVDNSIYRLHDIVNGLRISKIDTREGITYELPQKYYLDSFNELYKLQRWLRLVQSLDKSSEDSND